jgi:hypothetical protein
MEIKIGHEEENTYCKRGKISYVFLPGFSSDTMTIGEDEIICLVIEIMHIRR